MESEQTENTSPIPAGSDGQSEIYPKRFSEDHESQALDFRAFILESAKALASSTEPKEIMASATRRAAAYCNTDSSLFCLFNEDNEVDALQTYGLQREFTVEIGRLAQTEWVKHLIFTGQTPLSIDLNPDGPWPTPLHRAASAEGFTSFMSLPLATDANIRGAIILFSRDGTRPTATRREDLGALADITSLALSNAAMIQSRQWERLAQDQLLSVLGHELRTPLTSIMGFTQIVRRRISDNRAIDSRLREQIELIWTQVQRLNRLIDTFVDITNIERGEFSITGKAVDITGVLRSAVEQAQTQARRGHPLEVEIPSRPIFVVGDARRLEHVFTNVLSNAYRYSPEDKPVTVTCAEVPKQNEVQITIFDRGRGIPPEIRRDIFKRFYPSDTRKAGGLGLGLYVSRAIVEAHSGSLTVDSGPGKGTLVTIHLPTG